MLKSPLTSVLNGFNIKMYFPINLRPEIPILNGLYSLCTLNDKEQRLLEGVLTLKKPFSFPHFLNRKPHWNPCHFLSTKWVQIFLHLWVPGLLIFSHFRCKLSSQKNTENEFMPTLSWYLQDSLTFELLYWEQFI